MRDSADAWNRRERTRLSNELEKWKAIAILEGIILTILAGIMIAAISTATW